MLGDGIEFYKTAQHGQAVFFHDTLSRGRVEVCRGGHYTAVCADSGQMWDNRDAMVICRELGLSPYGEPTPSDLCVIRTVVVHSTYNILVYSSLWPSLQFHYHPMI